MLLGSILGRTSATLGAIDFVEPKSVDGAGGLKLLALGDVKKAEAAQVLALKQAAGLIAQDLRANNTVLAFEDPSKALKNFQAARAQVDQAAADEYMRVGATVLAAGFSKDVAMEHALERYKNFHKAETELLTLTHPYAADEAALIELASGKARRANKNAAAPVAGNP